MKLEKGMCYSDGCMAIRRIFNLIGCFLAIVNSAFDIIYPMKAMFATNILYACTITALGLRIVVNFAICGYLYVTWVSHYKPGLSQIGE